MTVQPETTVPGRGSRPQSSGNAGQFGPPRPSAKSDSAKGDRGVSVHLHIEKLVLDGLPLRSDHSPLLKAAVEGEIANLFAESKRVPHLGTAEKLIADGAIRLSPGATPRQWAKQIARKIYAACTSPNQTCSPQKGNIP